MLNNSSDRSGNRSGEQTSIPIPTSFPVDIEKIVLPGKINDLVTLNDNEWLFYSDFLRNSFINCYFNDENLKNKKICRSASYPYLGLFLVFYKNRKEYIIHIQLLFFMYSNEKGNYKSNYYVGSDSVIDEVDTIIKGLEKKDLTLMPPPQPQWVSRSDHVQQKEKIERLTEQPKPIMTNKNNEMFVSNSLNSSTSSSTSNTDDCYGSEFYCDDDDESDYNNQGDDDHQIAKEMQEFEDNVSYDPFGVTELQSSITIPANGSSIANAQSSSAKVLKEFAILRKGITNWKSDLSHEKFNFLFTHLINGTKRYFSSVCSNPEGKLILLKAYEMKFSLHEYFFIFNAEMNGSRELAMRKNIIEYLTPVIQKTEQFDTEKAKTLFGGASILLFLFQNLPKSSQIQFLVTFLFHYTTLANFAGYETDANTLKTFKVFNLLGSQPSKAYYLDNCLISVSLNERTLLPNSHLMVNYDILRCLVEGF